MEFGYKAVFFAAQCGLEGISDGKPWRLGASGHVRIPLLIDGDIFITDDGEIIRFVDGRAEGWEADPPPDTLLRDEPVYSLITSGSEKRLGWIYGYDRENARIIALDKANGEYREQYRLAGDSEAWADLNSIDGIGPIVAAAVVDFLAAHSTNQRGHLARMRIARE